MVTNTLELSLDTPILSETNIARSLSGVDVCQSALVQITACAAWAARQRFDEGGDEAPAHGGDRVRNMAFGPQPAPTKCNSD